MTPPHRGELALVLHTHMPYVEGYGTWPFGEEWLWEAIATCYLPLLEALDSHGAPLTLSLTPVLCDQLEAPGVPERLARFLREVRRETHAIDVAGCREAGKEDYARELERAAGDYERALARVEALDADLLGAFAPYASWTSSATHAVLPLLATEAGVRLQLEHGIAAHRARFAEREWSGGFWLPECAHAPWLDPLLEEAGVHATCVDLTDVLGRGAPAQLTPLATDDGPLLVPIDRATIELVWSDGGYPSHAAYRDYHAFTVHHHRVWRNDGGTYDHAAALAQARADAADFVTRAIARLDEGAAALGRPALAVCALDTELLGHWWYEGPVWLAAVLEEAPHAGLALATVSEGLALVEPVGGIELAPSSWGTNKDLSTWDSPAVSEFAFGARHAELRTVSAAASGIEPRAALMRAARELLAIQSSDWAFMSARALAADYSRRRVETHSRALDAALAALADSASAQPELRNLAPDLDLASLTTP